MQNSLPPFDVSATSASVALIPSYVWKDLPSAFVYGGIDVLSTYLHGYLQSMGYTGIGALALANGLGDSAKFAYFAANGAAPISGKPQ